MYTMYNNQNQLQINIPQPESFNPHTMTHQRHSSQSSMSSNGSSNTFFEASQWEHPDMEDHKQQQNAPARRSSKRGVSTFISKLFSMVSDRYNQHLISWNPNGSSFLVCNATRFSQEILPENFKHSNFSSFVRQLNMYGFHKINKSPRGQRGNNENEIWEFSHPKFQRGRPDLLEDIKRKAMDSELLRRETGDIHASFAMVQLSQADLLEQFRVLQENFSNLLQSFEQMKKVQLQQQILIKKLSEHQGVILSPSMNETPNVFITSSPSNTLNHWDPPQQSHTLMSPVYHPSDNSHLSLSFSLKSQHPLPPSPVSSV